MKRFIVIVVSMAILLAAPLAMARGNTVRAKLNRIWKKQQAQQERIDKSLDNVSKDIDRTLSRFSDSYGAGSSLRSGNGN